MNLYYSLKRTFLKQPRPYSVYKHRRLATLVGNRKALGISVKILLNTLHVSNNGDLKQQIEYFHTWPFACQAYVCPFIGQNRTLFADVIKNHLFRVSL